MPINQDVMWVEYATTIKRAQLATYVVRMEWLKQRELVGMAEHVHRESAS